MTRLDQDALSQVLTLLDLKPVGENAFQGLSPPGRWQRVFGGQVLGQALIAASRTVENILCHSLHAYFLRPGDPREPLLYRVENTRDGSSFHARRVVALQRERPIFIMACSFQESEAGFEHQTKFPDVALPESLLDARALAERETDTMPAELRAWALRPRAIEMRPVTPHAYAARGKHPPIDNIWLRASAPLSDDAKIHQALLAYASDMTLLDTALLPHGTDIFSPNMQVASLDHAMWFHRRFRIDDWLLYAQESPVAAGARGFARGTIYARDGRLVASVAQEGLIRRRGLGQANPD